MNSRITREEALALLKKYNHEPFHLQHALTVEGVMRWYAGELGYGGEADAWAIVGLLHDVLITLGLLAMMGKEIDLNIIAALMTLVGYSLNDTIIVYDRIRENLQNQPEDNPAPLADIINLSVNQTLGRTIMTSATTLIAALSLTILGGGAIHDFALTMSLGVFIGTFSSVFVSNPILLLLGDTRQYMVARKKVEYERPGEHGVV